MTDTRGPYTKDEKVDVQSLIREGLNDDAQALTKLRDQYNDKDLVNKMFSEYEEKMDRIRRKARKFANAVITRYSHMGTKRIMEKARKLKKKYGFSDDEFQAFVNIALGDKAFQNVYNVPNTPLSRTLGYTPETSTSKLQFKQNEQPMVQNILTLHGETSSLHMQVVVQSLLYRDCSAEALTGEYKSDKHNAYTHIPAVVAALFLPRIKYLDEHMLIASISNIIANKYNGIAIKTQPDYELFYDMITDPNEIACSTNRDNAFIDIFNRAKVQVELWKLVKELRVGRYYTDSTPFMLALEQCKSGIFDSPEMIYVRDEGSLLRKLMGVFSLRPTIVSIMPLTASSGITVNYPLSSLSLQQVTTIPIINLRIPLMQKGANIRINIDEGLEQADSYVENKMIVTKMKSVIYSRDLVIFYVNRRFQNVNFARLVAPYSFNTLPTTLTGFETLNETIVNYKNAINIGDEFFTLRSAVMVEKTSILNKDSLVGQDIYGKELIIGTTAGIVIPQDPTNGIFESTCLIYDPVGASQKYDFNDQLVTRAPITEVQEATMYGGEIESFSDRLQKRGTIFVYVKNKRF